LVTQLAGYTAHAQAPGDIFIRLGSVTTSAGLVAGNTIYLDSATSEIRFPIVYGNRGTLSYNVSNAFIVYSDDDGIPGNGATGSRGLGTANWAFPSANGGNYKFGAPSGPVSGLWVDTTGYFPKSDFGAIFRFNCFGCNGQGADTVIFAGAAGDVGQRALRPLDSGVLFDIRILAKIIDTGKWICIDSASNYPPTNTWKWAPFNCTSWECENTYPSWSGAACFVIQEYQAGPGGIANCVPRLSGTPYQEISYDFNITGGNQSMVWWEVTSGVGQIDSIVGVYTITPMAPGTYPVTVTATNSEGQWLAATCQFEVVIGTAGIANCVTMLVWDECEHSTYDFNLAQSVQTGVRWKVASGGGAIDSLTGVYWAKDLIPLPYPGKFPVIVEVVDSSNSQSIATCSFELQLNYCGIVTCPTKLVGSTCEPITFDFETRGEPASRFRFTILSGPGTIDSMTGVYTATGVPPGKYFVKVATTDTSSSIWTNQCWFDLWVSSCGIDNCPLVLTGVGCQPLAYDFSGSGTDQSKFRWAVTSGPGAIDAFTGNYSVIGLSAGQYPIEVTMTDIGDSSVRAVCNFDLAISACGISNCLTTINWNSCQPLRRDFDMVGPSQSGYRWFVASGVGSIDSLSGVYTLAGAEEGSYPVTVGVRDEMGDMDTAYCSFVIYMTTGTLLVPCPYGDQHIDVGDTKTQRINVLSACGTVKFFQLGSNLRGAVLDTSSGIVTYIGESEDADLSPHCMKVGVTDQSDTAYCDICWTVIKSCGYRVSISREYNAIPDGIVDVDITLETINASEGLAGFDLLVAYDNPALMLQSATSGTLYGECGWEYFNYRHNDTGDCGIGCPSGVVRVVGIADVSDGQNYPSCVTPKFVGNLPTSLASVRFLISGDPAIECMFLPIRFYWNDCGDNSLSNAYGTKLFINCHVFDFDYGNNIPIEDPYAQLPTYRGAPNTCLSLVPGHLVERGVELRNGGIFIVCVDSIDNRGDINLNGIGYEIADIFMFANYFIYGLSAFNDHVVGSQAASDVNADGITLSMPDLIYLIRVVLGDALPFPKVSSDKIANISTGDGRISITGIDNLGGLFMVLRGDVAVTSTRTDLVYFSAFDGSNTRVIALIPFDQSQPVTGFSGDLFTADNAEIVSVELVDINGSTVATKLDVPQTYVLNQNYPNPFNPTTTISFDLPKAGAYKITVYNTTGQIITELSGTAPAGRKEIELNMAGNASGVYFYKLEAEGFTATKKAVLLK
jgi:hypothetical protein